MDSQSISQFSEKAWFPYHPLAISRRLKVKSKYSRCVELNGLPMLTSQGWLRCLKRICMTATIFAHFKSSVIACSDHMEMSLGVSETYVSILYSMKINVFALRAESKIFITPEAISHTNLEFFFSTQLRTGGQP